MAKVQIKSVAVQKEGSESYKVVPESQEVEELAPETCIPQILRYIEANLEL